MVNNMDYNNLLLRTLSTNSQYNINAEFFENQICVIEGDENRVRSNSAAVFFVGF